MAVRRECWFDNRKSVHSLTEKNVFFVSQLWWSCTQEDWSKEKQVCENFVATIPPGGVYTSGSTHLELEMKMYFTQNM